MRNHRFRYSTPVSGRRSPSVDEALIAYTEAVADLLRDLSAAVSELEEKSEGKSEVQPLARYRLAEAADYLGTSPSTLKRRAKLGKFIIIYDGRTPYVMGAEILRYAREGAKRSLPARRQRRRKGHPPSK